MNSNSQEGVTSAAHTAAAAAAAVVAVAAAVALLLLLLCRHRAALVTGVLPKVFTNLPNQQHLVIW